VLGEAPADGAGLLGAEVEREQLLFLVRLPQRRLLLLRDHGEHARDGGAHHLAAREKKQRIQASVSVRREPGEIETKKRDEGQGAIKHAHLGELVGGSAGDLGHAEEGELGLELLELRLQLRLVLHPELVHLDPGCHR